MPRPLALFAVDMSAPLVVASVMPVLAQRLGAALHQEMNEKRFHFTWFTMALENLRVTDRLEILYVLTHLLLMQQKTVHRMN